MTPEQFKNFAEDHLNGRLAAYEKRGLLPELYQLYRTSSAPNPNGGNDLLAFSLTERGLVEGKYASKVANLLKADAHLLASLEKRKAALNRLLLAKAMHSPEANNKVRGMDSLHIAAFEGFGQYI